MTPTALAFETADRDEAHDRLLAMYVEHDLRVMSAGRLFGCSLTAAPADQLVLAAIGFDTDIVIDAPPMDDCYQLNVAVHGQCRVTQGANRAAHLENAAYVMAPNAPLRMDWSGGTTHYAMKLPTQLVTEHAGRLAGRDSVDPLDFPLSMPTNNSSGASFAATVAFVYNELSRPNGVTTLRAARRNLESMLVTQFLCSTPSSVTELLDAPAPGSPEKRVRDVADYIDQHPTLDLDLTDLTVFAGVGARTLQRDFHTALGVSPGTYLRQVRLDRVRDDLRDGRGSVSDIATRWGFYHPGRFAKQYRDRFDESPSKTRGHSPRREHPNHP